MKYKKIISVRLDERTAMLLNELSNITQTGISVIIRGVVSCSIEKLIDETGNWKIHNEKNKSRKNKL